MTPEQRHEVNAQAFVAKLEALLLAVSENAPLEVRAALFKTRNELVYDLRGLLSDADHFGRKAQSKIITEKLAEWLR